MGSASQTSKKGGGRFLVWSLAAWAAFVTFLLLERFVNEFREDELGLNRNGFDMYFEASLTGTKDFAQTVAGLRPEMNVIAICLGKVGGIDRFLNAEARAALESDDYFDDYDLADYILRVVLIADDQKYKTVYLAQYEPAEASRLGCFALSEIEAIISPPSLEYGGSFGSILIK